MTPALTLEELQRDESVPLPAKNDNKRVLYFAPVGHAPDDEDVRHASTSRLKAVAALIAALNNQEEKAE